MHNFTGKVYLADEPDAALDAKVVVDLNHILIRAGDAEIGSWQHKDVRIAKQEDGIHLATEGETLVLQLENGDFLLDLMGVNDDPPFRKRRRRARRKKPELMPEPPPGAPDGSRSKDVADESTSASFSGLRTKAAASNADETRLQPQLALVLGVAIALILLGAALNWGAARIFDPGSFPIARALAGFAGLTGLIGLYFAYFDRERLTGSALAISAGGVLLVILYFYARAAQLKLGFVLALVGAIGLVFIGVLGMSEKGAAARHREQEDG